MIGRHAFPIAKATFRFISDDGQGNPGWEFDIRTKPLKDLTPRSALYGRAPRFFSEGDPIPLQNVKDLTGSEIYLKEPFDPETGEVYFTLYVFEHGDLTDLRIRAKISYRITDPDADGSHSSIRRGSPAV
jgi:hypothetical protein